MLFHVCMLRFIVGGSMGSDEDARSAASFVSIPTVLLWSLAAPLNAPHALLYHRMVPGTQVTNALKRCVHPRGVVLSLQPSVPVVAWMSLTW